MKTSTRFMWIMIAVAIGLGLFAGGFLLSRSGWGMFGYGPGMTLAPALRSGASAGVNGLGFGMMSGFGGIFMILFWVAVIAFGVLLVSGLVSHANGQPPLSLPPADSALDILKKRYARGEITKEQFDEMRRNLNA